MKARLLIVLAAVAIAAERVVAWLRAPPTDFDDAYMFVRYADAWLRRHGLRWNPGDPPAYGATSMLHLAAVTALRGLHLDDARALRAASVGAAVLALAAMTVIAARFSSLPLARRWAPAVIPLVVYSEAFGFHATTGMDTMASLVANAALALAVLWLLDERSPRAALACALAGFVAVEARPDNALVTLLVPSLVAARDRRLVAAFALPFGLLVGASLVAKRLYFGTALPLPFWVKRPHVYGGFVGEYTWNPFWFLGVFLRAAAPLGCALVLCARRRRAGQLLVLLVPVAITFAALFRMNQIMGHLGRFYFPFLPWLVAALVLASDGARELRWREVATRGAVAAVLLVGGGWALDAAGKLYESRAAAQPLADLGGYSIDAAEPLPDADSWQSSIEMAELAAAAPPGTRFAMTEHGLVAARAPDAVVIDMLGLHDRDFALHGFSSRKLLARAPDLIWMPHPDYTQMIRDLYDDDEFWARYDYWPDALTFGVALRKDVSPSLRALWEARFHADHPSLRLDDYRAHRQRD